MRTDAMIKRLGMAVTVVLAVASPAKRAWADVDLFSRDTVSGLVDLRLSAADGERSWLDAKFGKLRYGGDEVRPSLADAAFAWRPQLSWDLSATIHGEYQDGAGPDLIQAYLTYKPTPHSPTHFSARFGMFYPEISLEHEGAIWKTIYTITPSAINSWVGEEIKTTGLEATVSRPIADHQFSATAAVFDFNDTSATLLTFRGWGLDDMKAPTFGKWDLPPLDAFIKLPQPDETYPVRQIDKRIGYYGRLEWTPPIRATFTAFYYNNNGNRIGEDPVKQWAWATEFLNLGVNWAVSDTTHVLSQFMTGKTLMGYKGPKTIWVDMDFNSAYLLVTQDFTPVDTVTGRIDVFSTRDNAPQSGGLAFVNPAAASRNEHGWALTADYRRTLSSYAALFVEALHVDSDRASRVLVALPAGQAQTMVQASLRLTF